MFRLERVSAERGGRRVLSELTAELPEGATAVVGPSGSGKSTLLRLLNRLADPSAGTVRLHGRDLRDLDVLELRRRVGLVPQLPALAPGTVAENVALGPAFAGRSADVERALALAGLDGRFASRPAERLSVGEQQRVMLARALALEPEVLLLDEPTSALDEAARDAVESALLRLRDSESASLVLVTHDEAQARRLATHLVRLASGRVAAAGSIDGGAP